MLERQIVIQNPGLNTDPFRDWTTHTYENQDFPWHIKEMNISPLTHPKVADLCAGNGRWAVRFVQNGWLPENITCIDQAIPNPSLVRGLTWLYWDLSNLGWSLKFKEPISAEVEQLKGAFDCVVTSSGGIGFGLLYEGLVCEFLAREGAFIWPNDVPYIKSEQSSRKLILVDRLSYL